MRAMMAVLAAVAALAWSDPPLAQETGSEMAEPEEPDLYRIQPGDVIGVQVLEDSSLNRELLVQPDGRVSFPLAGVLQAGGRTPEELQGLISRALSDDFLQPPTVTVSLQSTPLFGDAARQAEGLGETFFILGQVAQPGQFAITKPTTILQALAMAGGPTVFAATSRIQVRRTNEDGLEEVELFDFEAVEDGLVIDSMIRIQDGDVIYVPESGLFE